MPGSVEAIGNRGWESASVTEKGDVVAVWLDHRDAAARTDGTPTAGAHQHGTTTRPSPAEGVARAQLSQIFFARVNDAASGRAIAAGVCYCCKTSVATGPGGTVVAAWRHVYPGSIRDIAVAKSTDGGRTFAPPVRVSDDNWVLDGCPENGPAVAIDQANTIHVVWPTLVQSAAGSEENLALFYATSPDGQSFTKRQQIPTEGVARHPQLAAGRDGELTVVWDEQLKGGRRVVAASGNRDDKNAVRFVRQSISDESATYPMVASLAEGTIIAWTSGTNGNTVLRVRRHPASGLRQQGAK